MSKSKEAWELIRADGRLAAATDDQLTFVILAAAQHALSERGEHYSAGQICGIAQRLIVRCEPAVKRNGRTYDPRITADDEQKCRLMCDNEGELSNGEKCPLCAKIQDMRESPKAGMLGTLCYINDRVPCTVLEGSTRMRVLVDSASGRKVMTRRPNGEYAEQGLRSPKLALGWQELSSAGGMK